MKHPMQPLALDKHGTLRFKSNAIVEYLLDKGGLDMNDLAVVDFTQEDKEQFAQLIGYSQCGFGDLSYVSDESYETCENMYRNGLTESEARIAHLEETLKEARKGVSQAATSLFRIHPHDLEDSCLTE
jgi:hypothetical protein